MRPNIIYKSIFPQISFPMDGLTGDSSLAYVHHLLGTSALVPNLARCILIGCDKIWLQEKIMPSNVVLTSVWVQVCSGTSSYVYDT